MEKIPDTDREKGKFETFDLIIDKINDIISNQEKYKEKSMKLQEFTQNQHKVFFEKLNKLMKE